MKILLINDHSTWGGAEVLCNALSNELSSLGHEVFKLVFYNLPAGWPHFSYSRNTSPLEKEYFRRFISRLKPDILHCHNLALVGLAPLEVAIEYGIPAIYTAHDYLFFCPRRTMLTEDKKLCTSPSSCFRCNWGYRSRRWDARLLSKLPFTSSYGDATISTRRTEIHDTLDKIQIVTVSDDMRIQFENQGFHPTRIFNGLPDMKRNFKSSPNNSIIHLGRLTYEKGTDLLLKVTGLVNAPVKAYNIASLDYLMKIWESNSLNYAGFVSRDEVQESLASSRLLLSCSIWHEPFGLDVLEAMIYEKPVVATAIGGHLDMVVNSQTGYLASPNPEDIADCCNRLVADPFLAAEMGRKGRHLYEEKFTIAKCAQRYVELYQKVGG